MSSEPRQLARLPVVDDVMHQLGQHHDQKEDLKPDQEREVVEAVSAEGFVVSTDEELGRENNQFKESEESHSLSYWNADKVKASCPHLIFVTGKVVGVSQKNLKLVDEILERQERSEPALR